MFVYYVKKFDGTPGIRTSPNRPSEAPLEGPKPLHIQAVKQADVGLPLSEIERLYPPRQGGPGG